MNNFLWLEQWHQHMADGNWEQTYGIHIQSTDTPGWHVRIDLKATPYDTLPNAELKRHFDNPSEWMTCRIIAGTFEAHGGPLMLGPILQIFRNWIEAYTA